MKILTKISGLVKMKMRKMRMKNKKKKIWTKIKQNEIKVKKLKVMTFLDRLLGLVFLDRIFEGFLGQIS